MLKSFVAISQSLVSGYDSFEVDFSISITVTFKKRVENFVAQLEQIDDVTLELQKHGTTLIDCRLAVDGLQHSIERFKGVKESPFYQCKLDGYCIQIDAKI